MEYSTLFKHTVQTDTLYILCSRVQALNLVQFNFIVKGHGFDSKCSCMTNMRGWFGWIGKDDAPGVHS